MTTTVSRLCGQPTAADLLGIEIPPVPRCLCFLHLRGPHQSHFLSSIARLGENLRDCALLRLMSRLPATGIVPVQPSGRRDSLD